MKTGAKKCRVAMLVDGAIVREFEIELADDPGWWAHLDVGAWRGRTAVLRVDRLAEDSPALRRVTQADEIWDAGEVYREPLRAAVPFLAPAGLEQRPQRAGLRAGRVSPVLPAQPLWLELGQHALGPRRQPRPGPLGGVADRDLSAAVRRLGVLRQRGRGPANTSGMKRGEDDLLAAAYTSTGRGECIIFSHDRGRTWTEFAGNPVVKHQGRDPRLLWHEPTKRWVMAVYDESDGKRWIAFYTSPDLKAWTFGSRIEGFFECPDLFELPVDGDATRRKWVLTAASSEYMVGQFDGTTFHPETPKLPGHRGRGFYAAQTFSQDPRGRVVQIGWLQTNTPGMPFNQGMSLPLELSLHTTPDGPRLAWQPVEELKALRSRRLARLSGS